MNGIDPGWLWLIGGVLLLIAEVIAPGFFLVFVGAAAILTGLFAILFGFGLVPQLALFALYSIIAVFIGKRFYANQASDSADPLLNTGACGEATGACAAAGAAVRATAARTAATLTTNLRRARLQIRFQNQSAPKCAA